MCVVIISQKFVPVDNFLRRGGGFLSIRILYAILVFV